MRVEAKVGDEGQLFGSVTAAQVADALKEQKDLEVDRKRIDVKPIKVAGTHPVTINLYRDIVATILVEVNDAAGFAAADVAATAEDIVEEPAVEVVAEEIAE